MAKSVEIATKLEASRLARKHFAAAFDVLKPIGTIGNPFSGKLSGLKFPEGYHGVMDPYEDDSSPIRREILCAGHAVISRPSTGFADALEAAAAGQPSAPGFAVPVYLNEFRYWLVHGQPDALDGDVSWFLGPARTETPEGNGRIPYGHFTYEEADQMCCVPRGTMKAIVRQRQARARMECLPLPASVDPDFVRALAKDLEHGKSVPEVAKELAIRPAEVRELVRRQQLLTVVDEEPGLRCVVQGDAVAILRANGAASVSAARTAVSPGAE